jgi:periplasmic protein TonB
MELFSFRYLRAFAYAALVTIALSWLMHLLIHGPGRKGEKGEALQAIDFIRLKKDSDITERERRKPPPPPPPKTPPPPPQMKVATEQQVQSPTPFNIPNLGLSPGIGGGPFLGAIGGGFGGGDSDIIPLVRISPQYPRQAALDRIEGSVTMEFIVNPDGTVRNVRIVAANPPGVFEQAAITAALKWKFKPKVVDGKPVQQKGVQPMVFKLEDEE